LSIDMMAMATATVVGVVVVKRSEAWSTFG
jgi:hypothetical protein